jgi:YVTN family beta-propeller protein
MKRHLIILILVILSLAEFPLLAVKNAGNTGYLSPATLAASSDGQTLFIACATANRILIFDIASQRIKSTITVSESPLGLTLSPDNSRLFVTCAAPQSTVCVIDLAKEKIISKIRAGHTSMAPVCSPDGKTLYVCNRFNNAIGIIDLEKKKEVARIAVPREPVAAALTKDGRRLFVANHIHAGPADGNIVAASVSVIDVLSRSVIKEIFLPNGSGLLRDVSVSPDGKYAAVTHLLSRFHLPTTQIERGWINNNALTLIDVEKCERLNTVLLDNIDSGVANPWAVAWTSDGKSICVTHAGTHELTVIDAPALLAKLANVPAKASAKAGYDNSVSRSAADVPNDLAFLVGLKRRIKLADEKAPRALVLIGNRAYTANYFSDSLTTVDLAAKNPIPYAIALGLRQPMSVVRQGEFNFNDASICFQGWQSCASCHSSDARVDGLNWDNLNDGIGNPKNVKSLLLAHKTAPSMWLAVRESAEIAVRAGIKNSLFTVQPEESAVALDEYLKSLKPIPSPQLLEDGELSKAAQRGKKLFFDERVGCSDCHKPPLYTDQKSHDVGTVSTYDKNTDRFDTPSLIEVWRTAPYLHDGSAAEIRDVLTTRNTKHQHGSISRLTQEQIDNLVAYVLSL